MIQNCEHDKLKTIPEAGNFNTMNSVIENYIHCCTEITGNSNSVLFYNRGNYQNNKIMAEVIIISLKIVTHELKRYE